GSAGAVLEVLRADPRLCLQEVSAGAIARAVAEQVAHGAERVVVAGGDGTLCSAATALVDRPAALAVVPAGTLNHFAQALAIPTDPRAALEVALRGVKRQVDVGFVNERLFLNTSTVGAYVVFVRTRERLERWLGYYGASVAAAVQTFLRLRSFTVELEADG